MTLELASDTLPSGRKISLNVQDPNVISETKKNPIVIKEGVEYK